MKNTEEVRMLATLHLTERLYKLGLTFKDVSITPRQYIDQYSLYYEIQPTQFEAIFITYLYIIQAEDETPPSLWNRITSFFKRGENKKPTQTDELQDFE